MVYNATDLRKNIYKILDHILITGEVVEIKVPAGVLKYKILEIRR